MANSPLHYTPLNINESVLLTRKIVDLFMKFSDQREPIGAGRAAARIGWRPCRPVDNVPKCPSIKNSLLTLGTLPARGRKR
jgi:hypothetical protein